MRIKCGRCGCEFDFQSGQVSLSGPAPECKCPMCGYSKQDVQEANKGSKKVLNG